MGPSDAPLDVPSDVPSAASIGNRYLVAAFERVDGMVVVAAVPFVAENQAVDVSMAFRWVALHAGPYSSSGMWPAEPKCRKIEIIENAKKKKKMIFF